MTTLLQAIETITGIEQQLTEIQGLLVARYNRQQLTPKDITVYNNLRLRLYAVEMDCYGTYALQGRKAAAAVGADWLAAQIPMPVLAQAFPGAANAPKFAGLAGLGNPAVALPAIGLTGWGLIVLGLGAAVILLLGAMVITATLAYYLSALVEEYMEASAYFSQQEATAQECLRAGRTPAECSGLLASTRPPEPKKLTLPGWDSGLLIMGGGLGLLVLILGAGALASRGGGSGGFATAPRLYTVR